MITNNLNPIVIILPLYNANVSHTKLGFPSSFYSSNRNHTVQSVRRQVERRSLRRDHVRGLQRVLSAVTVVRGQLPVSTQQELRGGSGEPEPMSVLSPTKMLAVGHVP